MNPTDRVCLRPQPSHTSASAEPDGSPGTRRWNAAFWLPAASLGFLWLVGMTPGQAVAADTALLPTLQLAQAAATTQNESTTAPNRTPDVVYVPTPQPLVDKMLEMAEVKKDDVVYDLGCGDGRIVVTAAKKYGVKAFGFDIDPQRVKEAMANVKSNKVEHLVTIQQADIFTLDLTKATVVTLYLLPELNVKLMPQLAKLKPGSRIVSHEFDMRGAKPVQTEQVSLSRDQESPHDEGDHTLYKWVVPWEREAPSSSLFDP